MYIFEITGVIIFTIILLILLYVFFNPPNRNKNSTSTISRTFDPNRIQFTSTKKTAVLLLYKTKQSVDFVLFDSEVAATYWGLMIVQHSRDDWGMPPFKSDIELLRNWSTYTQENEFIVIKKTQIRKAVENK